MENVFYIRQEPKANEMPIKRNIGEKESLSFNNYFLLMSWIEIKAFKSLLKEV